jgi:hypothetical protein
LFFFSDLQPRTQTGAIFNPIRTQARCIQAQRRAFENVHSTQGSCIRKMQIPSTVFLLKFSNRKAQDSARVRFPPRIRVSWWCNGSMDPFHNIFFLLLDGFIFARVYFWSKFTFFFNWIFFFFFFFLAVGDPKKNKKKNFGRARARSLCSGAHCAGQRRRGPAKAARRTGRWYLYFFFYIPFLIEAAQWKVF